MEEWGEVLRSLAPPPLATIVLEGRNQTVYNRHQSCLPSVFAESATNCQVQTVDPDVSDPLTPDENLNIVVAT